MKLFKIRNQNEYLEHVAKSTKFLADIKSLESDLIPSNGKTPFTVRGYSYTAGCEVDFSVSYEHAHADGSVNWREHLNCPKTAFNNRMRATIQLFDTFTPAHQSDEIYISEQITPMFRYFSERYDM